jgi:ATP-dependent Zn protease
VARWVRDARRRARRGSRPLAWADILGEIAPPETRGRDQIRLVAAHEAGHAVAFRLAAAQRIDLATIRGEGGLGAWVQLLPADGRSPTREELEGYVVGVLGGRAGEEVLTGMVTGGSGGDASDLERATTLVTRIHADLGLGGTLLRRGGEADVRQLLGTDPALRRAVEADLHALYGRAVNLLRRYKDAVEAVASALAEKGTLSGSEIEGLISMNLPRAPHFAGNAATS